MYKFLIFCLCIYLINSFELEKRSLCVGKNATSTVVKNYCNEVNGTMILRCCLSNDKQTFLALDLTEANLTAIPDFTTFQNWNLSVIDLRDNDDLTSSHKNDFATLMVLDDLYLPENFPCPGGERAWEEISNVTEPNGIHCLHQIDICSTSTDLCLETASVCSGNGPNHFLCKCKPNYYGYKCLRHGTFPVGAFFGPTLGLTVVASVLLFWTQRRHVKK